MKLRPATVKETVLQFKKMLRAEDIYYKVLHISFTGSCYLVVTYRNKLFEIRFSDHHENNRKLPKYNVLVGYDLNLGTVSNSGKYYYTESQLWYLLKDIKEGGANGNKGMGKKRS